MTQSLNLQKEVKIVERKIVSRRNGVRIRSEEKI
jgi:hypothetical protein